LWERGFAIEMELTSKLRGKNINPVNLTLANVPVHSMSLLVVGWKKKWKKRFLGTS